MTSNEELLQELMAIKSQIVNVDGKVLLTARAQKPRMLELIKEAIIDNPLRGRIYLALEHPKTQTTLVDELSSSAASISREVNYLRDSTGIVALAPIEGRGNHWVRDPTMERVLNLSRHVSVWLADLGFGDN